MNATRMKEKRLERKISAQELADALGIAKSTIYRYENGFIEKMPVDRLEQIADILGTTPQYLMFWSDEAQGEEQSILECFRVKRRLSARERLYVKEYIDKLSRSVF